MRDYAQYRISDNKGDEEVLFDVIEYLDVVLDKYICYLRSEMVGQ